jgi:signal transduction histidine kinase
MERLTGIMFLFYRISLIGLFLLLFISPLSATEQPFDSKQTKRVVVLYSGPPDFPATEMTEKGIREIFFGNPTFHIQLFSEYLDLSRFRDIRHRTALSDFLHHRYGDGGIDLLISVDVPAAFFLLENAEKVFPEIPIVMCSIPRSLEDRLDASPMRARTTGVFEPMNARDLVDLALTIKPATKYAALVCGAFENDRVRAVGFRKAIESQSDRLQLIDLSGLTLEELIERTKKLPRDSAIFYSTFFVDSMGRSFIPRDVLKIISDAADVPVFGLYEMYLGYGIVGGRLFSMKLQGNKAAELGVRVLEGVSPASISFLEGEDTSILAYDWRQLKRFKISESDLPPGGSILYRQFTLWEVYRSYIIGTISLIVLESILIIALVINLQKRKRAEIALLSSREELKILAGRLISSQEEELSRLSREFHDDLAQRLAAVAIESGTLELQSPHIDATVLQKIGHIKEQLIGLSEDVHAISRELHPSILKDLGLVRAISSQCISFSDRENIPVDFDSQDIPETIPKEIALTIYRIIQESLRNIAKHSRAERVQISLKGLGHKILLEVKDDGMGFVPRCVRHTPGIGLASMRERVQFVNGDFDIRSEPGKGTEIRVSVPLGKKKE